MESGLVEICLWCRLLNWGDGVKCVVLGLLGEYEGRRLDE